MDEGDDVDVPLGEALAEEFRGDRLAPLDLQLLGLVAAALGHIVPLVREGAGHAIEDLPFDKVTESTLHDAPGGAGGDVDGTGRLEELLEARLDRGVEFFEIVAAVADHRLAEGLERFLRDLDGSGAEEFDVLAHKKTDLDRVNAGITP